MKEIPLPNKGMIAYVSDEDYERVSEKRWWAEVKESRKTVYARTKLKGKSTLMHRFILGLTDPAEIVDHIDKNGLNNIRENIRVCSTSTNIQRGSRPFGKSKYLGVGLTCKGYKHIHKDGTVTEKKYYYWEAVIRKDKKPYYCGTYKTEEDAARAYNAKALELYGEHAQLNTVDARD